MTTTATVLAWHGDQALRDRIVQRMREHRAADAFIQGEYQLVDESYPLGYRGCAIGCLLDPGTRPPMRPEDDRWWVAVEQQFGIDRAVARAIDNIFESYISVFDAGHFAVDVVEVIPVGADLTEIADWIEALRSAHGLPDVDEADELIERLKSAPVPARADR